MNKAELFEFLELPISASETEIIRRIDEKQAYFTRLQESAPTEFLRKLHVRNLEKLGEIRELYGYKISGSLLQSGQKIGSFSQTKTQQPDPLAWLIRHTELRPTVNFPLYEGKNYICRTPQTRSEVHNVVIDDDPYVSRTHAILVIDGAVGNHRFYLLDDASNNQGRASKNGTYINGQDQRITIKTPVYEGDTIQVGNTKLVLRLNNNKIKDLVHEVEDSEYMKTVVINIL